ncbi:MAG: aminotransferase class V-fold PLP-dependent enzyme [Oceanicola sp.]|nr:aminotransferase class V-fold PLP-dependent enzyme [Oceanicola sp.]
MFDTDTLTAVRDRFAHVDACPYQGPRIFFENAGGALTLKSVVETSGFFAAMPDNPGRDNPAGQALQRLIEEAKQDMRLFFNAPEGTVLVGESGTELIFRLIRTACMATPADGIVLSSSLEHPATRSAAEKWAQPGGKRHVVIAHDDATGTIQPAAYAQAVTADTRVATILHTSPVTGMGVDVAGVAAAIRAVSPDCFIIVDGIQHAAHGRIDISGYDVDGYVISPYKCFSRHGYGVAWASDRLAALAHDHLVGAPGEPWELGTRDAGAYATFRDMVAYLDWLGSAVSDAETPRGRIEAAGAAIHAHEASLTQAMLHGTGNLPGLAEMPRVTIIGGVDNPAREGLVCMDVEGIDAGDVVEKLNAQGIRTHIRKADHYSGNILQPLGLPSAVRVSLCHYNSEAEVARFLAAMQDMLN